MKKSLLSLFIGAMLFSCGNSSHAQTLIHYWSFNNLDSTVASYTPSIPSIHATYSRIDTTTANVDYEKFAGVANDSSFEDGLTGDLLNAQMGAVAGTALRARNPSDSMELLFSFPTTNYKTIVLSYDCQRSSKGATTQNFDYSIDNGATWLTSGLSITTFAPDTLWSVNTVNLTDTGVNNKAKVIFRIQFAGTTIGTKGNNRFDNLTVTGDTIIVSTGVKNVANAAPAYTIAPNPASNNIDINTMSATAKTISIVNIAGQVVYATQQSAQHITVNVADLAAGVYFARIIDATNGALQTIKFSKQ